MASDKKKMAALNHILIIEDDPDDQVLLKQAAEAVQLNASLSFQCDGESALQHLGNLVSTARDLLPDLVLLDLNLPGMHGLEVLQKIRSDARLRYLPVVILSTSNSADDISACYEAGANSYISKPRKFSDMTESLRTLEKYWRFAQLPRPTI